MKTQCLIPITSHVNETAQNNFYGEKGAAMLNSPPSSVLLTEFLSQIECAIDNFKVNTVTICIYYISHGINKIIKLIITSLLKSLIPKL